MACVPTAPVARTLTVLVLRPQVHARRVLMLRTVDHRPDRMRQVIVIACIPSLAIPALDATVHSGMD